MLETFFERVGMKRDETFFINLAGDVQALKEDEEVHDEVTLDSRKVTFHLQPIKLTHFK